MVALLIVSSPLIVWAVLSLVGSFVLAGRYDDDAEKASQSRS